MVFIQNNKYSILVKANTSKSEISLYDENNNLISFDDRFKDNSENIFNDINLSKIIVYVKSPAVENKANEEIVKLFKKQLKLKVKIVKGHTSKSKVIMVL